MEIEKPLKGYGVSIHETKRVLAQPKQKLKEQLLRRFSISKDQAHFELISRTRTF